jgi:hypothetical protein
VYTACLHLLLTAAKRLVLLGFNKKLCLLADSNS